MTLFRNGKRAREPLSQTDRSNRPDAAEDSSSSSSTNSARKRRKASASPPRWRTPFKSLTKFISSYVSPRPPLCERVSLQFLTLCSFPRTPAPRARLASRHSSHKPRNMVEITRNAIQPLPPSTLTVNARNSFPTPLPRPAPQPAPPVFRPHASTSTSTLSAAATYKWDVMEAKAAGRPPPPRPPRESTHVFGGSTGYRKKEPIGSHKVSSPRRIRGNVEVDYLTLQRKEELEDKHIARIATLGHMQSRFEQGRKEGMSKAHLDDVECSSSDRRLRGYD